MAIRVKHNVLVQISGDTDGKDKRYYPTTSEQVVDAFSKSITKEFSIAAASTEVINLHDLTTPAGMYIEADGDLDLIIDSSATAVPMNKSSAATGVKARFFLEGNYTSISLDNTAGASAVTGVFVAWGD